MAEIVAVSEESKKVKIHCVAYMFYYMLLFFAHWFGSARFDVDGDGDFDPEDVERWLEDHHYVHRNYQRPVKRSATKSSKSLHKPKVETPTPTRDLGVASSEPSPSTEMEADTIATNEHASEEEHQQRHSWFDRDGDGHVDVRDLMQTKVSGEAEEDIAIRNLVTGQIKPLFISGQCAVCLGLWIIFSFVKGGGDFIETKAGLDSLAEDQTDLRFYGTKCEDLRWQAWRWLTYQFTHVGIVHVMMNVFLNLILGLPLEGAEGHLRLAVMFNAGVLGGALANMFLDGHSVVVGCSGGCYSLIGIHTADLLMNWQQKKFRLPTLVLILLLISVDIGFGAASSSGDEHVSHTSHVGGAAAGLLIGILVGKNLKMKVWERCFYFFAVLLSLSLAVFSLAWLFSQSSGAQSIFEAMDGEDGWCWTRQVADESFPDNTKVYCVKCGTQACIDHFTNNVALSQSVSMDACAERGWFEHGY